jgi:hypothetical protein
VTLAAAAQAADPFAWFLAAWHIIWPIATTVGTLIATGWGLVKAWPMIRRVFTVTDIITGLPEQLADLKASDVVKLAAIGELKSTLDRHIADAAVATARWSEREDGLDRILAEVQDVKYVVKSNGGGSIKDAVQRIEERGVRIEEVVTTLPTVLPNVIIPIINKQEATL